MGVTGDNIVGDTMIMSYVYDTTAMTHSLKPLAKKFLGMEWASYDEMVAQETPAFKEFKDGAGDRLLQYIDKLTLPRVKKALKVGCEVDLMNLWAIYNAKRCTLDFHDIEDVANYCGSDVLATWKLHRFFYNQMTLDQRRIYNTLEMPTLRLLFWMEEQGIQVDLGQLRELHVVFGTKIKELETQICSMVGKEINPNSTKQLVPILEGMGLTLPVTKKGNKSANKGFLAKHKDVPLIDTLLKHSEAEKLYNTYLDGFLKIPTLPRIHSTFNQVRYNDTEDEWEGMSTSRLSSSNPNMQNIPKRGTYAKLIRQLFIPKDNYIFIVGDYSQIEYRILAHLTQDNTLLEAFRNGKDLHEEVAQALGCSREAAKQ
jgi:DNA polymerase-1